MQVVTALMPMMVMAMVVFRGDRRTRRNRQLLRSPRLSPPAASRPDAAVARRQLNVTGSIWPACAIIVPMAYTRLILVIRGPREP